MKQPEILKDSAQVAEKKHFKKCINYAFLTLALIALTCSISIHSSTHLSGSFLGITLPTQEQLASLSPDIHLFKTLFYYVKEIITLNM